MDARIYVVADAPEAQRIAAWLGQDLAAPRVEVRPREGSDETLGEIQASAPQVVVLAAGLRSGDALAFAKALRATGPAGVSVVLIADEDGPVRNALDAMPFGADRFLRRPLSRLALVFAVRSCLNLGRAGVVAEMGGAPVAAALSALGEIAPAVEPAGTDISSGVAAHTLDDRIDEATSDAIDAFLVDAVEAVLSEAPVISVEEEAVDTAPAREPNPHTEWRDSTLILSSAAAQPARVQAPEDSRTGTFVSALRRHMSAVEARLFGEPGAGDPPRHDDEGTADIDLDAIGVTNLTHLSDHPPTRGTDLPEAPAQAPSAGGGSAPRTLSDPALTGDLADEDVASILGRLAREGATARVVFRRGEARKTVWLEDGRPVFVASESASDRMGEMLVREGRITREQLLRAREVMLAGGRRMGEILVEQGALKRRELYPSVRRHVEDLLYSLFSWDSGGFSVTPGAGARDEKIRLAAPATALLCEGVRRRIGVDRLRSLVGPPQSILSPVRREDLADALAEADLASEERQLLPLFDAERSLAEIAAECGVPEVTVYQLAHVLRALGHLTPGGTTDGGRLTTGSSPPATGGTADAGIDRERVLYKYGQVLEADYFEILGVRRDASGYEVRRAFEAARRDYAPESFAPEVQRDLFTELASISQVLAEAQRILRDDALRSAYRDHLILAPE